MKLLGCLEGKTPDVLPKLLIRAGILFGTLLVIKVFLVISLEKNVFEDAWRVRPQPIDWPNFALFNVILLSSFISIGRNARSAETKAIRLLNGWLIGSGLVFVIFSLHNGPSNCFDPVLRGLFPFHRVYYYWLVALFFGKPWLVLYLVAYALIYWLLWRMRCEWRSFYILGGIAVFYMLLNLRELAFEKRSLALLNCLGAAAIMSTLCNPKRRLKTMMQIAPYCALFIGWLLFRTDAPQVSAPDPYLMIILSFSALFFVLPVIPLRLSVINESLSHWVPFFFTAFLLFSNQWYGGADNYNKLMVYTFSAPHYFFNEMIIVLALILFALLLSRFSIRTAFCFFDVPAVILIMAALVDFQLNRTITSRLNWNVLTQCDSLPLLVRTLQPYWGQFACLIVAASVCYAVALIVFSKTTKASGTQLATISRNVVYWPVFTLLVGLFSAVLVTPDKAEGFALTNIIRTHPAFQKTSTKNLSPAEFCKIATDLNFRHEPSASSPAPTGKNMNIVLIVLESTYNKYLSLFGGDDETEPLLKKYKGRMELFPNFYSTFPNSFHARFTVLSGLYPIREPVSLVNPQIDSKSLVELLHDEGYSTAIYQSDPRQYLGFADYLANRGIDHYYDCDNMPGKDKFEKVSWGVPEQATMEAMTNALASYRPGDKPFFMAYFPVAPHMPYDTALPGFKKFPSKMHSLSKRDYSGEYKNTLLYVDWIMTSILDRLQENELLDDTLVVITNDHGEMLGDEDGLVGHGWRLKPDLCNTPLIIMNPRRKGYRVNYTLGAQVDVLPTIASLLGLKLPQDNFYEGQSLYETTSSDRMIFFNSSDQRALIKGGKYYWEEAHERIPLVFNIEFQGTKTIFKKCEDNTAVDGLLNEFDDFQNSLLRRYHTYKKEGFGKPTDANGSMVTQQ